MVSRAIVAKSTLVRIVSTAVDGYILAVFATIVAGFILAIVEGPLSVVGMSMVRVIDFSRNMAGALDVTECPAVYAVVASSATRARSGGPGDFDIEYRSYFM
jgi:hypothetical protein